ncbi:protein NO VEIN domain-containing protein [Rathayibacter sp. AY1E4]|uniref:protein NO VEIN domain-containing protein n=1 Tax=Rathayibacter sp. AY1E4 TaxID=2080552 RepID=UPI0015E27333|nr:DUF3883 domain-containing protein [Rathayibacter sp. AY1E4]
MKHHVSLAPLLSLPDEEARQLLALLLRSTFRENPEADTTRNAIVGAAGEEAVARWCVAELLAVGHAAIAHQVQRVSVVSDRFGYDVSAPVVGGGTRKLEVKTTTSPASKTCQFFLARHEYEVGRRFPRSWALVACRMQNEGAIIVGWCRANELERFVPDDANGRWTEALISMPTSSLLPNAPSAV